MLDVTQLGEKIRLHRQNMGLTQSELAKRINVSFQAVSSWEVGGTLPDIENICRLSRVFGVSVDALLRREASENEEVMIAVDGGGTSAEFALFTSGGNILTNFKLPGTNVSVTGFETTVGIFRQGIDLCLARYAQVKKVFIGNAGDQLEEIAESLSKSYPEIVFHVTSDGVNALKSAKADAALICGTGSIMMKEEKDGYRFVGGWGYLIGDPGSAYNIGCDAVRAALSYNDGISNDAMIYCLIKEKYGLSKLEEYSRKPVSFIASLASVVFEAYGKGDGAAEAILHREMKELSLQVNAILPEGGRIVACGGIMEHYHSQLLPILKQYTDPRIEFVLPKLPPIYGACIAACEIFGVKRGDSFDEIFTRDYNS